MFWHRRYHQRLPTQTQCQRTFQPYLITPAATRRRRSHLAPSAQSLKREIRRHPSPRRYLKVWNMIHYDQYFSCTWRLIFNPIGYSQGVNNGKNPCCMNFWILFSNGYSAIFDKLKYRNIPTQNSQSQGGNFKNLKHLWIIYHKTMDCS